MPQLFNAFPLTIYMENLPENVSLHVRLIEEIQNRATTIDSDPLSWTGDRFGMSFLHQDPVFMPLFESFVPHLRNYLKALDLRDDKIDLYYQRSWPVIQKTGQHVAKHRHYQSHISLSYYLKMPPSSGGISFGMDSCPNEIAPQLFHPQMGEFRRQDTPLNSNRVTLNPKEGQIVIFPSKTLHDTVPSQDTEDRISISADIVMVLKQVANIEMLMPPLEKWSKIQ